MEEDKEPKLLFFLGAGASVPAGVPETFELVNQFLKDLEERKTSKELDLSKKILGVLQKSELAQDGRVDIELLLESVDQLEKLRDCIPLRFFERGDCVLGSDIESDVSELKKEIRDFIKRKGLVDSSNIQYLRDLLMFIEGAHRPLDIFSVNYDICIEQFCNMFEKEYVDGFHLTWEPKSFQNEDVDIRLYKIHGSITWYQTDRGSLVKLPIKSEASQIELMTGEKASALILYPMRKMEYSEPLMDLLMMLKDKLANANFAFVIGYSFRDDLIRRVFWNAAKKNKKLVVFLVSPSAFEIYEKRLRGYGVGIPSDLEGRVICLPYKFEKVLPLLNTIYLRNVTNSLRSEKDCRQSDNMGGSPDWGRCLPPLVLCEYVDKIEQVLEKGAWKSFRNNSFGYDVIEIAFEAFLTSLRYGDHSYKEKWCCMFIDAFNKLFDVANLQMRLQIVAREEPFDVNQIIVDNRRNEYNPAYLLDRLESMLSSCRRKSLLGKENSREMFAKIESELKETISYFNPFVKDIPLSSYKQLRRANHQKSIEAIGGFLSPGAQGGAPKSNELMTEIEKVELESVLNSLKSALLSMV